MPPEAALTQVLDPVILATMWEVGTPRSVAWVGAVAWGVAWEEGVAAWVAALARERVAPKLPAKSGTALPKIPNICASNSTLTKRWSAPTPIPDKLFTRTARSTRTRTRAEKRSRPGRIGKAIH